MTILVIGNNQHIARAVRSIMTMETYLMQYAPQKVLKGEAQVRRAVERASLVMFSGGPDITPSNYQHKKHKTTKVSKKRDELDLVWLEWAVKKGLPIIGVSRGMHLMWTYLGGTLIQNLTGHRGIADEPDYRRSRDHAPNATFNIVYNHYAVGGDARGRFEVPSNHKQMIYLPSMTQVASTVLVTADPPVGTGTYWVNGETIKYTPEVEAIHIPELHFLGFQWDISDYDYMMHGHYRTDMHREFSDLFSMHLYKHVRKFYSETRR